MTRGSASRAGLCVAVCAAVFGLMACAKGQPPGSTELADGDAVVAAIASGPAVDPSAAGFDAAPAAPPESAGTQADTPPTEHRAELKAVREINKANYKTELTTIEKEIGAP